MLNFCCFGVYNYNFQHGSIILEYLLVGGIYNSHL